MSKCYLASGWFNQRDDRILTSLESMLSSMEGLTVYRPRVDGIILDPGQKHSQDLRKKIFASNVENIDDADFLVVNLDCGSERLDTGTVWECARAVALGIPVIVYTEVGSPSIRLGNLYSLINSSVAHDLDELKSLVECRMTLTPTDNHPMILKNRSQSSPLIVSTSSEDDDILTLILQTLPRVNVIPDPKEVSATDFENVFNSTSYLILPIGSKNPVLTWYMSTAYALGIPVVTYASEGTDVNLMLILSVAYHATTQESLVGLLKRIEIEGVEVLEEVFDTSSIRSY